MRRLLRSTFGLAAFASLVLTAATLAIGLSVYHFAHEALEKQLDHRIAIETHALLAEQGSADPAWIAAAIERREAARSTASLDYILVDRSGRRLAGSFDAAVPREAGYVELLPYGRGGRFAQALTTALPGGGKLVVAADRRTIDELDEIIVRIFSVALGVMLLVAAAGAWGIGAITRRRLDRIDRTALAIIGGDLARRMPIDGSGSEFDRVSATLNRMLDRIAALMENIRQVSGDVAHDLRTPLTRLRNRLEEAQAGDPAAIDAAAAHADELLEIFAAVLRISEIEALGVREQFRVVQLGALIEELLETYAPDAEASGHRLVAAIDRTIAISGDRRLLLQLTSNLLDNALRHTPAGTTIRLTLAAHGGAVLLEVADDGPGVPDGDRDRLFQRFSRSERSRSSEGHGLGLALVAAIAAAHEGSAVLLSGPGFAVRVMLDAGRGGAAG